MRAGKANDKGKYAGHEAGGDGVIRRRENAAQAGWNDRKTTVCRTSTYTMEESDSMMLRALLNIAVISRD
jgi:hypothetical protein